MWIVYLFSMKISQTPSFFYMIKDIPLHFSLEMFCGFFSYDFTGLYGHIQGQMQDIIL